MDELGYIRSPRRPDMRHKVLRIVEVRRGVEPRLSPGEGLAQAESDDPMIEKYVIFTAKPELVTQG